MMEQLIRIVRSSRQMHCVTFRRLQRLNYVSSIGCTTPDVRLAPYTISWLPEDTPVTAVLSL